MLDLVELLLPSDDYMLGRWVTHRACDAIVGDLVCFPLVGLQGVAGQLYIGV